MNYDVDDNGGVPFCQILKLSWPRGPFEAKSILWAQVKVQWTEQLVATQQQKTEEIKKQTEQIKVDMEENNKYTSKKFSPSIFLLWSQAVADANRQKAVREIKIQENILEVEGQKNVSLINNQILEVSINLFCNYSATTFIFGHWIPG